MSTVLGFPDATSPTPETGVLWLTEGSGSTRDKKVPAGTLMEDLLGRAVNGQAAAASPIVGATDLLPVARGNTGGKASVDAVVAAGLAGGIASLAAPTFIDPTDTLVILQSGVAKEVQAFVLNRRMSHPFPATDITLAGFGTAGADVPLSDATADPARVLVGYDAQMLAWDFFVDIFMPAPATMGHFIAALEIPVTAFPADLQAGVAALPGMQLVGSFRGNLLSGSAVCSVFADSGTVSITFRKSDTSNLYWDDIASSGNIGLTLSGRVYT